VLKTRQRRKNKILWVSAPGKIILFGEHAVVHGKLGIATSIDKRANVKIITGNDKVIIESKNLNLKESLTEKELLKLLREVEELKESLRNKAKIKKAIKKIQKIGENKLLASFFVVSKLTKRFGFFGLKISIDSEIPKNLGSSSAIFSAIVLGISTLLEKKLSKNEIAQIANEGDVIAHGGLPSGIDASTVTYGGYVQYKKPKVKPLDINFKIPLLIVDSKEPAKTGKTVPYINKLKQEKPNLVNRVLERLNKISRAGLEALKSQNLEVIGKLAIEYYWELRKLNISTRKLDEIIQIALNNQVFGAKPTGGWGGGCCIVFPKNKDQERKLMSIYQKRGFKVFQTKLGVEGVRIEKKFLN
jgi:mevalonate kinase